MGVCSSNEKKMRKLIKKNTTKNTSDKSNSTFTQNKDLENSLGIINVDKKAQDNKLLSSNENKGNNLTYKSKNISSQEISNLNSFMDKNEIQKSDYDKEDPNDLVFNELKKYEIMELSNEYQERIENFSKILKNFNLDINLNNNLISNIIKNEDSQYTYKKKIIDQIKLFKIDDQKYKIDYLTILLIGRKEVGKTTLINYMLKIKEGEDYNESIITNENFISYHSKKVPYLKLVEFKGIGFDENSDPETIGQKTVKYIQNHIKSKEKNNYNDFVHCIWYCVTDSRFQKSEIAVLKKLKQAYEDKNIMPIIVVYTKAVDDELANKMHNYINKQGVETIFVKVLAKDMEMMDDTVKKTFGEKELLNKTLEKCTTELKGEMITLMTSKISADIKVNMLEKNVEFESKINEVIIKDFINNYKYVLKEEDFVDYIINIFGKNLYIFYENYIKKISNASLNLLNNSSTISSIKSYISYYKTKTKEIIELIIKTKANDFIEVQASKEKEKKTNMTISKKRRLKEFNKTNEIFLKKNFYYFSQKFMIYFIISKLCRKFFKEYRRQLDNFVKDLLEQNKDEEINSFIVDCFLTKLKNFADKINIPFEINSENPNFLDLPVKREVAGEEELYKNDLNSDSLILSKSNLHDNEDDDMQYQALDNDEKWFPLKEKKWKYLDNNTLKLLNDFLQKNIFQEINFGNKENNYDRAFHSLKDYIKNNLLLFFNSAKTSFIKDAIEEKYNKKFMKFDKNPILKVIESENASSIYTQKIKFELDNMGEDNNFLKIDYLSIIIIGQTGLGKSTLINCILKDNLAKEGEGDIVTTDITPFTSNKVPFLKIIDTRGIELNKEFGPNQILKDTRSYIKDQKAQVEQSNNYNDYVQCIWYCVKGSDLEPIEIEIIKELTKDPKSLPLIIVYTKALNKQDVNKMKDKIKEKIGDLPFVPVLGRSVTGAMKSFGLDNLLNKTLEVCQSADKGDVLNKMKAIVTQSITDVFNKINSDIKIYNVNNIVYKFMNEFTRVLNDKELVDYIFTLLEHFLSEYMKFDKNENKQLSQKGKENLKKSSSITSFIEEFIKVYQESTKNIVDPILEAKAIKYLDIQVRKEKEEFRRSLNIENKSDKKDFMEVIESFLNDNFYYISQKYIIYHLIVDIFESFSEEVENQMNRIVKDILVTNDAKEWFKDIYYKKFQGFKSSINKFRRNGKIYVNENDKLDDNKDNKNLINQEDNKTEDSEGPENLYPKFK